MQPTKDARAQVPVNLSGQVRTDDGQHEAGHGRQREQQHQHQHGGDEVAAVMRDQRVIDQEPDRQRHAGLEQHRHDHADSDQGVQSPVGPQGDPCGLVQHVAQALDLAHGGRAQWAELKAWAVPAFIVSATC